MDPWSIDPGSVVHVPRIPRFTRRGSMGRESRDLFATYEWHDLLKPFPENVLRPAPGSQLPPISGMRTGKSSQAVSYKRVLTTFLDFVHGGSAKGGCRLRERSALVLAVKQLRCRRATAVFGRKVKGGRKNGVAVIFAAVQAVKAGGWSGCSAVWRKV